MPERDAGRTGIDPVAAALAGGLGAWCCVLALTNLPSRTLDRMRGEDRVVTLLPNYRLFAPTPVTRDVRLIYRCSAGGTMDPGWRTALSPTPRHWRHAVWHPEIRREKGLFDTAFELCRLARSVPPDQLHALPPFQIIASVVRARVRDRRGVDLAVQFALLRHDGYAEGSPSLAFLSELLPVGGPGDRPA